MDQTFDIQTPTEKIYKAIAIGIGTLIGGPLAAGYLIAENFKALNKGGNIKKTWIFAITATLLIVCGVILIPGTANIPAPLIPLIYTAVVFYLVQRWQGHDITAHITSGGRLHSWLRTIIVGITGLAINIVLIFGFAILLDSFADDSNSVRIYGIQKHEITFDKKNISEIEVDNIADGLITAAFFDESVAKYVYLKKEDNNYVLSVSVNPEIAADDKALELYIQLRNDLQKQFPDNKIQINLVVGNLGNVIKKLE